MKFALKIFINHKMTLHTRTGKKRRIMKILRSIKFEVEHVLVWLKVDYGLGTDINGRKVHFTNIGKYKDEANLWLAFNAFTEEDLW